MAKLGAMARYEVVMMWRRGSLPILIALMVVLILGMSQITAQNQSQVFIDPAVRAASAQGLENVSGALKIINVLTLTVVIFGIALPLFLVETIPLDRQFKVRELMDAVPISRAAYLGGKLLGAWAGLALILLVAISVNLISARLMIGPFDARVILFLWLVMALPVCLTTSTISVLMSAFSANRRQAVFFGIVLLAPILLLSLSSVISLAYAGGLIDPIYTTTVNMTERFSTAQIIERVSLTLAGITALTLAVWLVVWVVERWREAR
jgi:hypothetical protein